MYSSPWGARTRISCNSVWIFGFGMFITQGHTVLGDDSVGALPQGGTDGGRRTADRKHQHEYRKHQHYLSLLQADKDILQWVVNA